MNEGHEKSGVIRFALWVIVVHAIFTTLHGAAHQILGVTLSKLQTSFVMVVILLAPLVAGLLLWKNVSRIGGIILLSAMTGALVFGVYNHFVAISADHVSHLANTTDKIWVWIFQTTAVLIAIIEMFGIWAGLRTLKSD